MFKKRKLLEQKGRTLFNIEKVEIPELPEIVDKTKFDLRYPLISPYVYAHIHWDDQNHELIYSIEEPELNLTEKRILNMLEDSMKELINISFIGIKSVDLVIEYLEKNIKVLLSELRIKVNDELFLKLMYYLYRDFVGLNEVEPFMNDYYIEDIECNGLNTPVYIVHRKYRNLRTNIIYKDNKKLRSFVEKLAQKSGKYISYASPLLDAALPDGSRVNATYTQEISSRGPTFTIRKFTKEPWSPVKLMQFGTVSPELLAYLWLLIEYESNIMVIGGTGSGKCVTGETPIYLANGKKVTIKELVDEKLKDNLSISDNGWEFCNADGTCISSLNLDTLKIEKKEISKFWRHKAPKDLYKVITRSGRKIITTGEHPFFILNNGDIEKIRADKIEKKHRIAVPRRIHIDLCKKEINLIDYLKDQDDIYVIDVHDHVRKLFNVLVKKFKLKNEKQLALYYGFKPRSFSCWKKENCIPLKIYCKLVNDANTKIRKDLKLKAKTSQKSRILNLSEFSPKLFRFLSMVLADGHLGKAYVEFHNSNYDLLNEFIKLGKKLFGIEGKIKDYGYRVAKAMLCSSMVAKLLNKVFEVPFGNKARIIKVPSLLFENDEDCIKEFISGIIDCEGYFNKVGLEIGMSSDIFLDELAYLFNRLGIVARRVKGQINISGFENVKFLKENISLRDKEKYSALVNIINRKISRIISNVDLIPNVSELIKRTRIDCNLTQGQVSDSVGVSRRLIGMWENGIRNPSFCTFNKFANFVMDSDMEIPEISRLAQSDIFWDEIQEITVLNNHNEKYVYDLTIEENHNFLAGNIPIIAHNTTMLNALAFFIPPQSRIVSIEDTRELNLLHENWLPSVARTGIGMGIEGRRGEIDLFALLRESFRQRPDYVIVGEVRGKEAYVLFQGMSAGHPSFGTMHAEDVKTLIRRLETPPINLSPSLIESLDVVCVMTEANIKEKSVRRIREIVEIEQVRSGLANIVVNTPFIWNPKTDMFYFKMDSRIFDKIVAHHAVTKEQLYNEFKLRSKLLMELYKRNIVDFKEVQNIISAYYKDKDAVLRKFNLK